MRRRDCSFSPFGVRCGVTPAPYDVTFPDCTFCIEHFHQQPIDPCRVQAAARTNPAAGGR